MKLLLKQIFFSIVVFTIYLQPQVKNSERGDGFWTLVNTLSLEQILWSNDTLYAARGPRYLMNGGVYRSVDGGMSWDTLYSVPWVGAMRVRIFLHPKNNKILYLINDALYKSTDYGQNWSVILNSTTLVKLVINPKNPLIMYVTKTGPFGSVYKTTNGGTSWFQVRNGLLNNYYFAAGPIDICHENPDTILLGTNIGLYRSTNGGSSWDTTIVKGYIYGINFHPNLSNIAFASTDYDLSTYKTTTAGETWKTVSGNSTSLNFIFHTKKNNIIYNTSNLKSIDTGKTWFRIDTLYSGWTDIANDNREINTLFALNYTYGLFVYTDVINSISDDTLKSNNLSIKNYPNPFNTSTKIQLTIPQSQHITIQIFNVLGELITTILNDELLDSGTHHYFWEGKNSYGNSVSTGVYLCRFISDQNNLTQVKSLKLILLK